MGVVLKRQSLGKSLPRLDFSWLPLLCKPLGSSDLGRGHLLGESITSLCGSLLTVGACQRYVGQK